MKTDKDPFTDAELAEFKALLDAKLAEANADLELLKQATDSTRDVSEPGGQTEGEQELNIVEARQLMVRQRKYIELLEEALARIANKTYGFCRITGVRIDKERLRSMPHAVLSIQAKTDIAKRA